MIGIVAEGPADVAVLRNILKGKLGIDRDLTFVLRPELTEDATDRSEKGTPGQQRPEEFSNWMLVLEECRTRTRIAEFLQNQIEGDSVVVIHLDTAEAHLPGYDVARPDRGQADYVEQLRARVVEKIDRLLGPEVSAGVRHAVAVEETDAWVLTIHDHQGGKETGARQDPKKRLLYLMTPKVEGGKAKARRPKDLDYHELSRDFRDPKQLQKHAARNRSLALFVESLGR